MDFMVLCLINTCMKRGFGVSEVERTVWAFPSAMARVTTHLSSYQVQTSMLESSTAQSWRNYLFPTSQVMVANARTGKRKDTSKFASVCVCLTSIAIWKLSEGWGRRAPCVDLVSPLLACGETLSCNCYFSIFSISGKSSKTASRKNKVAHIETALPMRTPRSLAWRCFCDRLAGTDCHIPPPSWLVLLRRSGWSWIGVRCGTWVEHIRTIRCGRTSVDPGETW